MAIERIRAVYFSPTGGTGNVVRLIAGELSGRLGIPCEELDLTLPEARDREYVFGPDELVVAGSPVYAGRIPNKIAPDLRRCLSGEGRTAAVPVVVYGNRSFGGALSELGLILKENGFDIAGGAAVVTRHAFTDALAPGRPDEKDRGEIRAFAGCLAGQLESARGGERDIMDQSGRVHGYEPVPVAGGWNDIPPYYTPLKEDGTPAKFLKAKPVTDRDLCDDCGICRAVCPAGSIDGRMETSGICIKCQACVRKCPKRAKYFTDGDFLSHVRMLERDYRGRADNCFYLG